MGWGIIRSTAHALAEGVHEVTLRTLLGRIASDTDPFAKDYTAYSVCMTTQADADHMWGTFGGAGGVRFGLRPGDLVEGIRRHQLSLQVPTPHGPAKTGHFPRLLPVHYDADDLIDTVETMIHKVVMPLVEQRKADWPNLDPTTAANTPFYALKNILVPMALSFKRHRFREEREWRIVLTGMLGANTPATNGLQLKCADETGNVVGLPLVDELPDPMSRATKGSATISEA